MINRKNLLNPREREAAAEIASKLWGAFGWARVSPGHAYWHDVVARLEYLAEHGHMEAFGKTVRIRIGSKCTVFDIPVFELNPVKVKSACRRQKQQLKRKSRKS